jgi:hypothetical protein
MSDEDWRRENLPSVPLGRKSPTHHDVVEEEIIPEALPQLVRDDPNLGCPWREGEHHGEDLTPDVLESAGEQHHGRHMHLGKSQRRYESGEGLRGTDRHEPGDDSGNVSKPPDVAGDGKEGQGKGDC